MQTRVHKMLLPRLSVWLFQIPSCLSANVFSSQASSRGIKNTYSVEQKKKKQEEIEKRMAASGTGGEGGLRVSLKMKQCNPVMWGISCFLLFPTRWKWKIQEEEKWKHVSLSHCVLKISFLGHTGTGWMAESFVFLPKTQTYHIGICPNEFYCCCYYKFCKVNFEGKLEI